MIVEMSNKTTVKQLITALLEMPMESKIEICIRDENGDCKFASVYCAYEDEYNGRKSVVLTSK